MAMLSKERDRLLMAVRSYKSLFDTTNQLVAELRSMSFYVFYHIILIRLRLHDLLDNTSCDIVVTKNTVKTRNYLRQWRR